MHNKSLTSILKKKFDYKINGSLWIECEGEEFFGRGCVKLLRLIEQTGSINKAAKEMGMSYKKAWEMINELNTQAAKPLVITQAGGEKGGGSIITEETKTLIAYHKKSRERFLSFLKKFSLIFFILLVLSVASFTQTKLTVAAAANVQYVLNELVKDFESSTGIKVDIILNSSGKITAQIKEGAPYDVFVSADIKYPQELYKSGYAIDSPKVYANGLLVLWTTKAGIKPESDLKILISGAVKKIAIANPATAPYGMASVEAMNYYKVYDKVKDKLVFGESISQTSQYINSGAADIGFTAKSIVLSNEVHGKGTWIDVDRKAYNPIRQGAVILKHGNETNRDAAQKFYDYLYSQKAKNILKKYGYVVR